MGEGQGEKSEPVTSAEETKRAICHESGHAIVALHFGFHVEAIKVKQGRPHLCANVDSPQRTPNERYVFLAGGIAGEEFVLGNHDVEAMSTDQQMISDRGGGRIETYLPQALTALTANKSRFRKLRECLTFRVMESAAEASFGPDPDSFDLLSAAELARIWTNRNANSDRKKPPSE